MVEFLIDNIFIKSANLSSYLDLTFTIEKDGKLSAKLYDKRDDFDFHIVNFPFLSSNIPSGPSYGVYISQFIGSPSGEPMFSLCRKWRKFAGHYKVR